MQTYMLMQRKPLSTASSGFTPLRNTMLQGKCACGQHSSEGGECAECSKKHEGTLQHAAVNVLPTPAVPSIVHEVLNTPGQPLDTTTRSFMESRFSHDFSHVRVHADEKAAESARAVNALAYTVGHDMVFGSGQLALATSGGLRLMAHELTHVIQQSRGHGSHDIAPEVSTHATPPSFSSMTIGEPNAPREQEADTVANAITGSSSEQMKHIHFRSTPQVLHRQSASLEPTKQEVHESQLRKLAARPGLALEQWRKLKQNERDIVLWEMINRYGSDFSTDFLNYARGEKKANISSTIANTADMTPKTLTARGYRFAGDPGSMQVWVHPSGHEILLTSPAQPKAPVSQPDGIRERCNELCAPSTDSEDECNTCCEEQIPEEEIVCRRACKAPCADKL